MRLAKIAIAWIASNIIWSLVSGSAGVMATALLSSFDVLDNTLWLIGIGLLVAAAVVALAQALQRKSATRRSGTGTGRIGPRLPPPPKASPGPLSPSDLTRINAEISQVVGEQTKHEAKLRETRRQAGEPIRAGARREIDQRKRRERDQRLADEGDRLALRIADWRQKLVMPLALGGWKNPGVRKILSDVTVEVELWVRELGGNDRVPSTDAERPGDQDFARLESFVTRRVAALRKR